MSRLSDGLPNVSFAEWLRERARQDDAIAERFASVLPLGSTGLRRDAAIARALADIIDEAAADKLGTASDVGRRCAEICDKFAKGFDQ